MQIRNLFTRLPGRPGRRRGWAALAAAVSVAALVVVALAGAFAIAGHARAGGTAASRSASPRSPAGHTDRGPRQQHTAAGASSQAGRTSCTAVAHIGDSTSVGMVSAVLLPDPAQRLQAQYERVGVKHVQADASGGRSIVEEMPGQVNGYNTARAMASHGFHGCWVIALGTNDTANVAAGSAAGRAARISEMMSVAHGQPVLWVNLWTLNTSGLWSQANMQAWNAALRQATAKYPNLKIFDWASVAKPAWFSPDGIHYTSAGYAARAHAIADALASAFPASGHSTARVVH